MEQASPSPLTHPLFGENSFTFPTLMKDTIPQRQGAYNPLLDAMMVNTSASDLLVTLRISHEVAHRLFAINSVPLRMARHIAGAVYSYTWLLLGKVAEYRADLVGTRLPEITVQNAKAPHEASELIGHLLQIIEGLNSLLRRSLNNVRIIYELAAIEAGIRLLQGHLNSSTLEAVERVLVDAEAKEIAPHLYHDYPAYWVIKQWESEGAPHEELHKALALLQQHLMTQADQGYFAEHRTLYEQLFKEMYAHYKQTLDAADLAERIISTNRGISSPLKIGQNNEGRTMLYNSYSAHQWATEKSGPTNSPHEASLDDAWRVAQYIDLDIAQLPEFYRLPYRMMSSLDFLLFQHHLNEPEKDNAQAIEPSSARSFTNLLTFLSGEGNMPLSIQVNEQMAEQATRFLHHHQLGPTNMTQSWWRWLLLFETLRTTLASGMPAQCPLKGYKIDCPPDCPLKANLGFLARHSQMVDENFCHTEVQEDVGR